MVNHNKLCRYFFIGLLAIGLVAYMPFKDGFCKNADPTVTTSSAAKDRLNRDLQTILDDKELGVPSMGVAVAKNGKIVYDGVFGKRYIDAYDHEHDLPLNKDTKVRIASISKTFTAVAYMQLVEQGKINLDEDISKYLGFTLRNPNYPEIPITSRMLLSHTSSLRDGAVYAIPARYSISEFFVPQGRFYEGGAHFAPDGEAPGAYFCYTNLNYGILATIIEKVTNTRFDRYMQEAIFKKMDMQASYNVADFSAAELYNVSPVYQKYDGSWSVQVDDYYNNSVAAYDLSEYKVGSNGTIFAPQGGLRISLGDLEKWLLMFINDGKYKDQVIFSKQSMETMFKPYWVLNHDKSNGDTYGGLMCCYGLGIHNMMNLDKDRFLADRNITMSGHFGEAYGLLAGIFVDRKNKQGFIYFINGSTAPLDEYLGQYSGMYIWEEKICTAVLNDMFADH